MGQLIQDRLEPNKSLKRHGITVIDSSLVTGAPLFVDSSNDLMNFSEKKYQDRYTGIRDPEGFLSGTVIDGQLAIVGGNNLYQAHYNPVYNSSVPLSNSNISIEWKPLVISGGDSSIIDSSVIYQNIKGQIIYVPDVSMLETFQDTSVIVDGNLAVVGRNTLYQATVDLTKIPPITWKESEIATAGMYVVTDASGNYLDNVYFDNELSNFTESEMKSKFPKEFLVVSDSSDTNGISDRNNTSVQWTIEEAFQSLMNVVYDLQKKVNLVMRTFDNGIEGRSVSDLYAHKATTTAYGEYNRQPFIKSDVSLKLGEEIPPDASNIAEIDNGLVNENGIAVDASVVVYNDNILDSCVYPYINLGAESEFVDPSILEDGINPNIPDGSYIDSSGHYKNFIDPGQVLYEDTIDEKNLDSSAFVMPLKHFVCNVAATEEEMNKYMQYMYPNEIVLCIANNSLYRYDASFGEMAQIVGRIVGDTSTKDTSTKDNDITMAEILQTLTDGSVNQIVFRDINNTSTNAREYRVGITNGKWQIEEKGGTLLSGTSTTKPIRLDTTYVSSVVFSSLIINEFYGYEVVNKTIGDVSVEHNTSIPISHNFIELGNLDPDNDIDLSNLNLQYFDGASWHVLYLRGKIKRGSTFLIRGSQCAAENAPSTIIDVSTYDMEWYENGELFSMHNDYGTLYLSKDVLDASGNINDVSTRYISANMSDMTSTLTNLPTNNFIDLCSWATAASGMETLMKHFVITSSSILTGPSKISLRNFMLDRSAQANPGAYSKIKSTFWDWIDVNEHYLGNESSFRPRSSAENKNIYTTRSYFRKLKPYMVTCSFGIDATTTRTFNWVSTTNDNQYIFYRKKGTSDAWTIKESYTKDDGTDSSLRDIIKTYSEMNTAKANIEAAGGTVDLENSDSFNYKMHLPAYDRIKWETSGNTFVTTHKVIVKNGITSALSGGLNGKTVFDSSITYYTDRNLTTISETPTQYTKGTEYEYMVGPGVFDQNNNITGPDSDNCSDLYYFQIRPAITNQPWEYVQHTDEQGFNWREYETWRRSADVIRAQFNPQFTINTGDMTQNGNRLSEWIDYYNGGTNLFNGKDFSKILIDGQTSYNNKSAGVEQMNVVGNNDLSPIVEYRIGNGDDSATLTNKEGKVSPKQFNFFYCYELDLDNFPHQEKIMTANPRIIKYTNASGNAQTETVNVTEYYIDDIIPSCYSYNYNNCHFIGICSELTQASEFQEFDADTVDSDNVNHSKTNDKIIEWIQNDLNKWYKFSLSPATTATYPWCIVYMHELPYTVLTMNYLDSGYASGRNGGSKLNDNLTLPFNLSEKLSENHVRLAIGGHKHTTMQTWPIFENVHYQFGLYMDTSLYNVGTIYNIDLTDKENYIYKASYINDASAVVDISVYNYISNSDLNLSVANYTLLKYTDVSYQRIQQSNNLCDVYPWEVNEKLLNAYKNNSGNITRIVNSAHPYFVLPHDISTDSSLYDIYNTGYNGSSAEKAAIFRPDRFINNGIPLIAKDVSSYWTTSYIMSQATGNKVISNKEMPSINIPWGKWYTPAVPSTASGAATTSDDTYAEDNVPATGSQMYPYFIRYVFNPDNTDSNIPGNISVYQYRVHKTNFANTPSSTAFYPETDSTDPLGSIPPMNNCTAGWIDNSKHEILKNNLTCDIEYISDFENNYDFLKTE